MRDYTGVSTARLEVLEERLKSDVVAEIDAFQGRVLLHTESAEKEVVPVWETVGANDVRSLRDVMDDVAARESGVTMRFVRIPITSESSPDVSNNTYWRNWLTSVPRSYPTTRVVSADRPRHQCLCAKRPAGPRTKYHHSYYRSANPAMDEAWSRRGPFNVDEWYDSSERSYRAFT
jgi:hypothetical protein